MKSIGLYAITCGLAWLITGHVWAQPGTGPGPGPRMEDGAPSERGRYRMDRPIERYLNHVRDKDPLAYEQMMKLRKEDPEAFRAELRTRLQDRVKERMQEEGRPFPDRETRERIQALSARYQQATTEEDKQTIRAEIKTELRATHERMRMRVQKDIERAEEHLNNMRELLKRLSADHEERLDRHLDDILSREKPAP
jgi:hypothetical protein